MCHNFAPGTMNRGDESAYRPNESSVRARALVGGDWRDLTAGGTSTRRSPYDQAVASVAAICAAEEVGEARRYAASSARSVRRLAPHRRAEILEDAARALAAAGDHVARLESSELGKPLKDTRKELTRAAETLQIAAAEARRLGGELLGTEGWPAGAGSTAIAFRVPVGVVLAITPFNAPLNLLTHKIAAYFAAGNTTLGKSPPQAPGTSTALVELLLRAGMPPGGDPAAARRGRAGGEPGAVARGPRDRIHGQPRGGPACGRGGRRQAPRAGAGRQRGHHRVRRRRSRRGGARVRRDRVQQLRPELRVGPARLRGAVALRGRRRPVPTVRVGAGRGGPAGSRDGRRDHGRSSGGRQSAGVGGRGGHRRCPPRAGRHRQRRDAESDPAGVPPGHR